MSEEEDVLSVKDPNKLTVSQLKSRLSASGVDLPMANEKKAVYVQMFVDLQEKKKEELDSKGKKRGAEKGDDDKRKKKAKTEESPAKETPKKGDKKKRKSISNPFQSGGEEEAADVEESDKEKTKKRQSLASLKETPKKSLRASQPSDEDRDDKKEETPKKKTPKRETSKTLAPATTPMGEKSGSTEFKESIKETPLPIVSTTVTSTVISTSTSTPAPAPVGSTSRRERYRESSVTSETTTTPLSTTRQRRYNPSTTDSTTSETTPSRYVPRRLRESTTDSTSTVTSTSRGEPFSTRPWRSRLTEEKPAATSLETQPSTTRRSPLKVSPAKPQEEPSLQPETPSPQKGHDFTSILYLGLIAALWVFLFFSFLYYVPFEGQLPAILKPIRFCSPDIENTKDCIPCPSNGKCISGKLVCNPGYIVSGTTCIEDKAVVRNAAKITTAIESILKQRNGQYFCREIESRSISEAELEKQLRGMRLCSEQDFDLAYNRAVSNGNFKVGLAVGGREFYLEDPTIMEKPFMCSVKLWLSSMKWYFMGLMVTFGFILYLLRKKRQSESELKQANELVEEVYTMLKEQRFHAQQKDNVLHTEPYIAITHIRDTLLKPPINKAKRDRLWNQVQRIIAADTRVQEQALLLHGEQHTVWQWTAPVLFTPSKPSTYFPTTEMDEGSASAVEKRYPDIFPKREFRAF